MFSVGAFLGSFLGSPLADTFGRKIALLLNAILGLVLSLVLAATRIIGNYWVTLIARVLMGANVGIASATVPVYLIEVATVDLIGIFGVGFQFGFVSGILLAQHRVQIFTNTDRTRKITLEVKSPEHMKS